MTENTRLVDPNLAVFGRVDFDWTRELQSVWQDSSYHAEDLHKEVVESLISGFLQDAQSDTDTPLGEVVVGPAGIGKTHLLGTLRERVWDNGGWFVLLDLVDISDFWPSTCLGYVSSLHRQMPDGLMQYQAIIKRLAEKLDSGRRMNRYIKLLLQRRIAITKDNIDRFLEHLAQKISAPKTLEHQDVFRAFLLLNGGGLNVASIGYSWLQGMEIDQATKEKYGFIAASKKPSEIVRGLSWIMGLTGPTMIAVDQIDAIVSAYNLQAGVSTEVENDKERRARAIIEGLAVGLMELHDVKGRAQVVVACIEGTWAIIKEKSVMSATQRFREPTFLKPIARKEISEIIIGNRLAPAYESQNFLPPYGTWPFSKEAFAGAISVNPRQLLMRCEGHRKQCLDYGEVIELTSFSKEIEPVKQFADLEPLFEQFKSEVDIDGFWDRGSDHSCRFLFDILRIYVRQSAMPEDIEMVVDGDLDQDKPPLHGRLRFIYHNGNQREEHYSFRFINHDNPTSFQTRLKAAITASGLDRELSFRHLTILRNAPLPTGKGSVQLVEEFESAGGAFLHLGEEDLRALAALQQMLHMDPSGFDSWLQAQRPLCDTRLFKEVGLCGDA